MAVDRVLLAGAEESVVPAATLRFYSWSPAAVSLGRFQPELPPGAVRFCRASGIAIVRRPTGGGGVLHADEVTYAVAGRLDSGVFPRSVVQIYRRIAAALCRGLERLGVKADFGSSGSLAPPQTLTEPCFSRLGRWEVRWQGRKIIGSAQARCRDRFLQHGSIPIRLDRNLLWRAFGYNRREAGRTPAASLAEALGRVPGRGEIVRCLVEGFREEFRVSILPGGLTRLERDRIAGLLPSAPVVAGSAAAPVAVRE